MGSVRVDEVNLRSERRSVLLMFKNIVLNAVIAALLASLLVACGESGEVDPYPQVTLQEVTRGMVVSKGMKYKFNNPEVIALNRNLGLIREGNLVEFISGRSLEDKLAGKLGDNFELAVTKEFSPYVHFKVEKIFTDIDTTFMTTSGAILYPKLWKMDEFGVDGFEEKNIDNIPYNRTGTLRELVDQRIRVSGKVTREMEEGKPFFVIHGANAMFRVADMTDGLGLFLKIIAEKGYAFEGGIILTEVEAYGDRMKSKVAGTVEIQYVKYGDKIVTG
jgi:hypothetical protein